MEEIEFKGGRVGDEGRLTLECYQGKVKLHLRQRGREGLTGRRAWQEIM